jgi:8-oxo-dGTP diphosphatase
MNLSSVRYYLNYDLTQCILHTNMTQKAPEKLRFAAMAVDVVLFAVVEGKLSVLLGTVNRPPYYTNVEAFIGGLIESEETAETALERHLKSKTELKKIYTEQLYTFSDLNRDTRNRVISISYLGLVRPGALGADLASGLRWCPVRSLPKLAYDHTQMFGVAMNRLKGKISYTNIAQYLLPKEFTLSELQAVYELILSQEVDKRNFRKKILALDLVVETGDMQQGVKNRPAALYRFATEKLTELPLVI